jgi:DNA-binding MarR family transcriptional regulator
MDENLKLLKSLARRAALGHEWSRPMDLGAYDGSGHSARLKRLSAKGLVERERRNSICNVLLNSARGSYVYRISDAGRRLLAEDAATSSS